ncbi:MAG TPA: putative LPS assembly protein LptD [Candidatus Deferrimicrobium sp.]|nr:putative LPS assembly protein LptD [Candidatus Deferrimicrobium sp.]
MRRFFGSIGVIALLILTACPAFAQQAERIFLEHADQVEVLLDSNRYVTYVNGNVRFQTETGRISCDSAVWRRGASVVLNGNVVLDESGYRLKADSAFYNITTTEATARGAHVELWSYQDSLYAAGPHAWFDNARDFFLMEERPVLYVNYPDSAHMIEVIAERIEYDATTKIAEASGDVVITSGDVSSKSDCAIMNREKNTLDLFGSPRARWGGSEVTGGLISIFFENKLLRRIDVIDSAQGEFSEPVDSANNDFDKSTLKGRRIILEFDRGQLDDVLCYGQAYSWYYPSRRGSNEFHENSVSGDTIRFEVADDKLRRVEVIDGAIGRFVTGQVYATDTARPPAIDTIDYASRFIAYDLVDSLITLRDAGHVQSGTVSLDANRIYFDTKRGVIEACAAEVDTLRADSGAASPADKAPLANLVPSNIPVILRDKTEEIHGDYLEYSTDTKKGRIVRSKSAYEAGYYYGQKLFREQKHVFYVDGGRYTTCDANEPHYHFHSKSMKLIEGDKLIAKPVVLYISRIPIVAIPYYVFPLKKGRHSGFLPFTFGRFERGERYIQNVGYYWAASEHWDWQGSLNYYERRRTLSLSSRVNFVKRYVLDGYATGTYTTETGYDRSVARENKSRRWVISGAYNHTFSPSFSLKASGEFLSDARYYTDYSANIDERLNREIKSRVNFRKQFGKQVSLAGEVTHTVNLDRDSRTDHIPSFSLSLPTIWPLGSGRIGENGQLQQKWYQNLTLRYTPSFLNYSDRVRRDSIFTIGYDTTITFDSSTQLTDTIITTVKDTLSFYRKQYAKVSHNPSLTLPTITLAKYFIFTPRFGYNETWFKIFETDKSRAAGIDASTTYCTYSYSAGVGFKTAVYGTVYPNLLGLVGLRHVFEPSVTYGYSPEINRHPNVRAFAGGGAGSQKSSAASFAIKQIVQAKVKRDQQEQTFDLLTVSSGFSYNFEAKEKPYSNLATTFQTAAVPNILVNGSLTHSFYEPQTDKLNFWNPYLLSFDVDAAVTISGGTFLFDDARPNMPQGAPSAPESETPASSSSAKGWHLSAAYSYGESGRGAAFRKDSFIRFMLKFNLTRSTSITYSQQYDIVDGMTISNSVNIVRHIHCWTGSLWWVPIGSNRGFGFRLNVTLLPEVKIDNNYDTFSTGVLRRR